jgi:hypothetical protein
MQIQSTTYNNKPNPKAKAQKRNPALHIQEGTGVAVPNPPHTPPIQRSWDDLVTLFRLCHMPILFSEKSTIFK